MNILVVNCGSSSLKYQLFNMENKEVIAKGRIEEIGSGHSTSIYEAFNKRSSAVADNGINILNHEEALKYALGLMTGNLTRFGVIKSIDEIHAVGHRVVNGGPFFNKPTLITEEVLQRFKEESFAYAPLHNPKTALGLDACMKVMPKVHHVLVFDTMFHQTMPKKAYMYALPLEWYEEDGVRRYGAHGMSHEYVTEAAATLMNRNVDTVNLISCHLGNGSSIAAIKNGKCVDTSMGFTPLEGVVMGTRSGNIDPEIINFEMKRRGYTAEQIFDILNNQSGLFALSNGDSDLRSIWNRKKHGDEYAIQAVDSLIYSVKKYIGAYMAVLGRVDCITFEGGIGEHCPELVRDVLSGLEMYGIEYDDKHLNDTSYVGEVSTQSSKVKVFVIATNEEIVIADYTQKLVQSL